MTKNTTIELSITSANSDGAGIAHADDGRVVFVAGGLPGERVSALILKVGKSAIWAKATEILEPSPERIAPECPYFPQCGGCGYLHASYREELRQKLERVNDALRRIGKLELSASEIVASESRYGYRNKAIFNAAQANSGAAELGFYQPRSHRVVGVERCMLQSDFSNRAAAALKRWIAETAVTIYDEASGKGLIRKLFTRGTQIAVVGNGKPRFAEELVEAFRAELPECGSVLWNEQRGETNVALGEHFYTLYGSGALSAELSGLKFELSPAAFFQVNEPQAERLYAFALDFAELSPSDTALDLFSGVGTLTLLIARHASRVIGVEISEASVENSLRNAALNGITNAEFVCRDASELELPASDAVFLDPPRKGLAPELIRAIADSAPSRVVYISCDPATLARDLKLFAELGYRSEKAVCVDMFPCTSHVETVVRLVRS